MIVSNCLAIFFSVETEQADAVADVDASVRRKFRTSTVALLDFFFWLLLLLSLGREFSRHLPSV